MAIGTPNRRVLSRGAGISPDNVIIIVKLTDDHPLRCRPICSHTVGEMLLRELIHTPKEPHLTEIPAIGSHQQTVAILGIIVRGEDTVGIPDVQVAVVILCSVLDGVLSLLRHGTGTGGLFPIGRDNSLLARELQREVGYLEMLQTSDTITSLELYKQISVEIILYWHG